MAEEKKTDGPDLEKLRDEKCIPIAQNLLKEISVSLIPDVADENATRQLALRMLTISLKTDMNIATEVSYIPQLILGALAGLNRTVQEADKAELDEARYNRIAREILTITADANVRLANVLPEESIVDFAPVKEKISKIFTDEKLNSLETKYIMEKIFNAFTEVNNLYNDSIATSSAKAEAQLFGIDDMSDLTMNRLNEVLTLKPTEQVLKPAEQE